MPEETKKAAPDKHVYKVFDTLFEVDKRYEIIDPIGQGAYGIVVAARDKKADLSKGEP